MTRADLVKAMAERTSMSQTEVDKVLTAFLDEVTQVVAKGGEKLTIPGLPHVRAVAPQRPHGPEPPDR